MSDRWASSCVGKRHYNSERRADEAAKASQIVYGVPIRSYPCEFCKGKFVVGNTFATNGKKARMEREGASERPDEIKIDENPQIGV
jgi:hypothetical protein